MKFYTNRDKITETIRHISSEDGGDSISNTSLEDEGMIRIEGILKAASAKTNSVEIISEKGESLKLKVPDGLSDIVKKYWDNHVIVECVKKKNKKTLHLSTQ